MFTPRGTAISVVLISMALFLLISQRAPASLQADGSLCRATATRMARLELLFGMTKSDGRNVAEFEWQTFVDKEITPRFPQGLTVMSGIGQWRNSAGTITRERSRMLVVWYSSRSDESEADVEAIRSAYKAQFGQESVMRVDGSSCVSF